MISIFKIPGFWQNTIAKQNGNRLNIGSGGLLRKGASVIVLKWFIFKYKIASKKESAL